MIRNVESFQMEQPEGDPVLEYVEEIKGELSRSLGENEITERENYYARTLIGKIVNSRLLPSGNKPISQKELGELTQILNKAKLNGESVIDEINDL